MLYYITRVLIALVVMLTITTIVYIVQDDREKKKQQAGQPVKRHNGKFWAKVYAVVTVLTIVIGAVTVYTLVKPDPYEVDSVHLAPSRVEFRYEASDETQTAILYQRAETEDGDLEELQERLKEASGMTGKFTRDGNYSKLQYNQDCAILIDVRTLNWGVTFNDTGSSLPDEDLPTENKAKQLSEEILKEYGIDMDTVEYDSFTDNHDSGNVVICYKGVSTDESKGRYTGMLKVKLGTGGELIELSDGRVYCEAVKTVSCRSEREAIQDTLKNGDSEVEGTGYVDKAELGYSYNEESGYLIPTWKYEGQIICDDEEKTEYYWYPDISAMK
ncbi:MAG: hypothetical protein ACI3XY_06275 [Butyricicoccaceae bacterium]